MTRRTANFLIIFVLMCGSVSVAGTIQLPQTGQTKCYNESGGEIPCAGTGQDGEIRAGVAWPNPRFTPGTGAEADCMTDNLTGLMWPKNGNLPNGTKRWGPALDFVANLNGSGGLCGHSDWRLPNINELESLVNVGQSGTAPWLNTQGFTNVQSNYYWSSSTLVPEAQEYAWMVVLWESVDNLNEDEHAYVWPVRAGQGGPLGPSAIWRTGQTAIYHFGDDGDLKIGVVWPSPRFSDQGNSTVIDNLTGLMWTQDANAPGPSECTPHTDKFWQGALDHVKCLNTHAYLGYADWHLPNRKELFSLIDHSRYNPPLPAGHPFTNVMSYRYWSSSTLAGNTGYAWVVDMFQGGVIGAYKTADDTGFIPIYVWPVRAGLVCSGWKVRVTHTDQRSECYDTLQAAYSAAVQGDRIQAQAITFTENLVVANPVAVTLEGGYDSTYSSNTGGMTSLQGMLETYPDAGTLTIENFIITNQ